MGISLCMICKNEEDFIGNALESAKDFVDEIVIVDTGSQDNTLKIAKTYTEKIKISPWKKDFSFHRNEALSMATCPWILFLDCDETLNFENNNKEEMKKLLNNTPPDVKGYNLNIINLIDNNPIANFSALRLFKNFQGFIFSNPIHEQIVPSIIGKFGVNSIGNFPLTINHYGYSQDVIRDKNKIQRNLEILHSIDTKDSYIYAMIGDEYLKSNDLFNAIYYYEKVLEISDPIEYYPSPFLLLNYITSLINIKTYDKALDFIYRIQETMPNFIDLYFLEFWIFNEKKNYKEALINLDKYISGINNPTQSLIVKKFYNIYDLKLLRLKTCSFLNYNQ